VHVRSPSFCPRIPLYLLSVGKHEILPSGLQGTAAGDENVIRLLEEADKVTRADGLSFLHELEFAQLGHVAAE
jgi:hypothetical protein